MTVGDRGKVLELAIELARDLGAGWALDSKSDYDWMHAIRRRDGARISINGAVKPRRFSISGHSNCPDYPIGPAPLGTPDVTPAPRSRCQPSGRWQTSSGRSGAGSCRRTQKKMRQRPVVPGVSFGAGGESAAIEPSGTARPTEAIPVAIKRMRTYRQV